MTTYDALCGVKKQSQGELERHQSGCLKCAHATIRRLVEATSGDIYTDSGEYQGRIGFLMELRDAALELVGRKEL